MVPPGSPHVTHSSCTCTEMVLTFSCVLIVYVCTYVTLECNVFYSIQYVYYMYSVCMYIYVCVFVCVCMCTVDS